MEISKPGSSVPADDINTGQRVYILADGGDAGGNLCEMLATVGARAEQFTRASACIEAMKKYLCDLIVCDLAGTDGDGIEFLGQARRIAPGVPVIAVTGCGNVSAAVGAMKAGACDVLEKPVKIEILLESAQVALDRSVRPSPSQLKALTRMEARVLSLILQAKNNREIAATLNRSIRTVEDHRKHVMEKVGVSNIVELIKRVTVVRLPQWRELE